MIRLFIQKHMAVFSLSVLIVIVGVIAYVTIPRESSPEIKQPYIFITTTWAGVSATEIETLVTQPIEKELEGMNGLAELTSESRQNVSFIFAEFSSDVSVEAALRRTKDRVDIARPALPEDANDPNVREFSVSDWPMFVVVLSHPDGIGVIDGAAKIVRDELNGLPGVLDVDIAGNTARELAIELDPYRMASHGFSIDEVTGAIGREHVTIPGGVLKNPEKNYAIAVTGEISDPRQFGEITVTGRTGAQVPLSEIANVAFQDTDASTYSRLNGTPAITLSVKKRLGANILDLADAANARIEELRPTLPAGTEVFVSYDESTYIRDMLADLENNMVTGFILVLLVTILFLGFRNSLFVSMAIPLSMLLSFFILQLMGITLNTIVLFSLILALGMLVDNGIVIVENIFRHQAMGKSRVQSAIDGAGEVAGPIAASTLTTLLAFFPIMFMPGMMGDFMSYLPKTVIVVLASSLFIALVINPTFCATFLTVTDRQRQKMEGGGGFARVQNAYTRLLKRATRHSLKTVAAVTVVVVAGFVAYGVLAAEVLFFPEQDPERARIELEAPQGTPLERTDAVVREVEALIPEVEMSMRSFEAVSGRGGGSGGSDRGEINISFAPYADREISGAVAIGRLQERLRGITGAVIYVQEGNSGPPTGDDISYEIRGEDYAVMGEIAAELTDILTPYADSFKEIRNDFEADLPEVAVNIDRRTAAHYGLSTAAIARTIRTAVNGSTVGSFRHENEEYDIVVRYRDDARDSLSMLRNIEVIASDGRRVPLSAVAAIEHQSSVSVIKRRNLNRAVNIGANFRPDTETRTEIVTAVDQQVEELNARLPAGYTIGAGAGFDVRNESTTFLIQAFVMAIFLIFIVLVAQFNSLADPFIILYAVFLSLGGVMWGFALGGQNFVIIMSGIGSIALAGVAVNNCIVLVDYTHKLIREGSPWRDAVVEAGRTRLRPVILTALTTVLALLPMAVGVSFDIHTFRIVIGSESAEVWKAFAWTMLYGLTFATVTTLVVVPAMLALKYRVLEKRRPTAISG
ncbi:MAG: efflux RND transporter permease subunit [Spirochaeta sp.]|jgi:multidrug efflux pump|nr:efflux RND transporter permease subunit [Spirochaeta sp.]